jgi:hypothetical protein
LIRLHSPGRHTRLLQQLDELRVANEMPSLGNRLEPSPFTLGLEAQPAAREPDRAYAELRRPTVITPSIHLDFLGRMRRIPAFAGTPLVRPRDDVIDRPLDPVLVGKMPKGHAVFRCT